ncbi:MAG: beta-glucuronidase, partial [Bacteroidota bacterium]|nr:beta-glucuronidase [Bacteroidota bacterium]
MKKHLITIVLILFCLGGIAISQTVPRPEYPRPQFERNSWMNLNGTWSYIFDFGNSGHDRKYQESKGFDGKIIVPFCPESKLSGVGYKDFINDMWYHRMIDIPAGWSGKKIILHFGAVDYKSEVYIDGKFVGRHFGGTSSFEYDITPFVTAGQSHNL